MAKSYPHFVPVNVVNHPIMGELAVYKFRKYPKHKDAGCQTSFFTNGAKKNNPNQFGIKIFSTSIEAYASFQRQRIAFDAGLAPPVGCMVQWIVTLKNGRNRNMWGYQTCIADCSDAAKRKAQILGCPPVRDFFLDYCDRNGITPILSEPKIYAFYIAFQEQYNNGDHNVDLWNVFDTTDHPLNLKNRLKELNIVGTQYDDISDFNDNSGEWSNRLRLGETWRKSDDPYMSNDLHRNNLGLWNENPVVIDFGYHIACPNYRHWKDEDEE